MRLNVLLACAALSPAWGQLAQFMDPNADPDKLPTVPEGYSVKFYAREPIVRQPSALCFDARGRLMVGMGQQYRKPRPETTGDEIVILLDTNKDGVADSKKVFAQGFNCIQGLAWRGRDLWVANAPDLTVVRDTNGDDVADEYVRLYTDLGNLEHGLHGLTWGPDGWLYMSKGNSKGLTQPDRAAPKPFRDLWGVSAPAGTPDLPPAKTFSASNYKNVWQDPDDDWGREGGILRCRADGTGLEIFCQGLRNPWDIAFDAQFRWLGTDNDQTGGDRVFAPLAGAHFGWNHPWSAHWGTAPHEATAPVCGPVEEGSYTAILHGDSRAFPACYGVGYLVNDWMRKITFLWKPTWQGATIKPTGGTWQPFITGGQALYRPTDMAWGPDGALYVAGWGAGYGANIQNGVNVSEGRIFRIECLATSFLETPQELATLPKMATAALVEHFEHPMARSRLDVQDELLRRGEKILPEMQQLLTNPAFSLTSHTWAAWTVGRLGKPGLAILKNLLAEPKTPLAVRLQALRQLPEAHSAFLLDPEPQLRLAALEGIILTKNPNAQPELETLLAAETDTTLFYTGWQALARTATPEQRHALRQHSSAGVRRGALLSLLEENLLSKPNVEAWAADSDASVRSVAALWLTKSSPVTGAMDSQGKPASPDQWAQVKYSKPAPPPQPTTVVQALDTLSKGDAARGRLLFLHPQGAGCVTCHRMENQGNSFGPDLADTAGRLPAAHLVESILQPNAVITEGYQMQLIEATSATYSGILLEESGLTLTLALPTGQKQVVSKADIKNRQSLPLSAMTPYDAVLPPQAVADLVAYLQAPKAAGLTFEAQEHTIAIRHAGLTLAVFSPGNAQTPRPHFSHLRAPSGVQVTRNYPPQEGTDRMDHPTMHPGLHLAFGDLNGQDFWRLKAKVEQSGFLTPPASKEGRVHFATKDRYVAADGVVVALGENSYTFTLGSTLTPPLPGLLIQWKTTLEGVNGPLQAGGQHEMGLGIRLATSLSVLKGGRIISSRGGGNEKSLWGQSAQWWDYAGWDQDQMAGILTVIGPRSTRPSWGHVRDYGFLAINPTDPPKTPSEKGSGAFSVPPGEKLVLHYGLLLHATPKNQSFDEKAAAEQIYRILE